MKLKLFSGTVGAVLEDEVNLWLKQNPFISVEHVVQNDSIVPDGDPLKLVVGIWYFPKESCSDNIDLFLNECCILDTAQKVSHNELYPVFLKWWKANLSQRVPLQKRFTEWFRERFETQKRGNLWYHGVGLKN